MLDEPKLSRCGTCHWYEKQSAGMIINAHEQGFCFASPPQCTTVPGQGGAASFTSRPTVKPTDRCCGLYEYRGNPLEESLEKDGEPKDIVRGG